MSLWVAVKRKTSKSGLKKTWSCPLLSPRRKADRVVLLGSGRDALSVHQGRHSQRCCALECRAGASLSPPRLNRAHCFPAITQQSTPIQKRLISILCLHAAWQKRWLTLPTAVALPATNYATHRTLKDRAQRFKSHLMQLYIFSCSQLMFFALPKLQWFSMRRMSTSPRFIIHRRLQFFNTYNFNFQRFAN